MHRSSGAAQAMATATVLFAAVLFASAMSAQAEAPIYPTPQSALESFVAAMETGRIEAAIATIDSTAGDLVQSDDPAATMDTMQGLLAQYREGYRFVPDADGGVTIELGEDGWPFPVPLVKVAEGWSFDAEAARDELRNREIGGNELEVIGILRAYVDIQSDYRKIDHDGDGVLEFADAIISSEGKRDGLFWPGGDSPIGDIAARASLDGYREAEADRAAEPLFGYYFRILTSQGPTAPGGAMAYQINGNMVGGHAALAVPAVYGETGIHSFLVSEAGTIYQADQGDETLEVGFNTTIFDLAENWKPVE